MTRHTIMRMMTPTVLILVMMGCGSDKGPSGDPLQAISAESLAANTEILASDEFEGRFPASPGEEKTMDFLKTEFETLGLQPGNGGSYFQDVPMVKITADPAIEMVVGNSKGSITFDSSDQFVALTRRVQEEVSVENSELIFAGYGIIAPEYGWNDYEGLDVKGKTVVVLVNDPGFATEDDSLFNGRAMTYYGRWTYKYEEAARQGAAGCLIIHETAPAAYGWGVVKNGWTGANFYLMSEDDGLSRCAFEGWLSRESAEAVFILADLDLDRLMSGALESDFEALPLNSTVSLTLNNTIERSVSKNFLALLPGSARPEEALIFTAHWDHFGIDPALEGDQIYNGALDNATGTAGLIELARAFLAADPPPDRSILFLSVTAEEQGLLGSDFYARNPVFPKTKTAAVINMDALDIYGPMKDITIVGFGQSELDDYAQRAAAEVGRRVRPDPTPERGSFYRSDHFPFARQGIPALYVNAGIDHVEHGEAWTLAQRDAYLADKYHKPTDEFDPNWDLSGAVDDLRLIFNIGYTLSRETTFPNWKEGSEFKARRDADMGNK